MLRAIDIERVLGELEFLDGRSPQTPPEQEARAFARLADYRNGGVFVGGFSGQSAWERHANGDELVHVLDGDVRLTVMADGGPEEFDLRKGMVIVVPRGHWHRFRSEGGVTVMTVTPQPTDHAAVDDPRTLG